MPSKSEKEILDRYRKQIGDHIDEDSIGEIAPESMNIFSRQYKEFREESLSNRRSWYESACSFAERVIEVKPQDKILPELEKSIDMAHLDVTPVGASSFATLSTLFILIIGAIISVGLFTFTDSIPYFTILFFLIFALISVYQFPKLPIIIATRWRLKASSQMVLCILYCVIYMRHTSNLEHAIKFAAEHTDAPLSLDLRKVFWDVETGKFSTIKESLDNYLQSWRSYNLEFVTAFHLIESSLFEPTESRRIELLEKGLDVMLEGSYERMLHYAQDLKSPITTLHMLGVILPILGLVLFPLVGAFLSGLVKWYHLAILYNIILPILVYVLGVNILSKRPAAYGQSKSTEKAFKSAFNYLNFSLLVALFLILVGMMPVAFHVLGPAIGDVKPGMCASSDFSLGKYGCFFGYIKDGSSVVGPFGIGALIFSFFIPAGIAVGIGLYYRMKTKKIIDLRNETKALESEFSSALFQLGNRIGDGVPAETAFNRVAETLESTPSGRFFSIVDNNIRNMGMGIKEAIFNSKNGAILSYPSPLIESSMEVLLESSRKGPKIVSQSLVSISNYIDRIHRVSERLKDLLAEVLASIKSQISFMTPAIAGIVVGISSMIVNVLVALHSSVAVITSGSDVGDVGSQSIPALLELFQLQGIIPTFHFQLVVGIYVIELAVILTIIKNGIENGDDKVTEEYDLGRNVMKSYFLYAAIAIIVTILFSGLASVVLSGSIPT